MRRVPAAGLCALLAALAGCGASAPTPLPQERLDAVAAAFHDREANRAVAPDQIPLKFLDMEGKTVDLTSFRGTSNVLLVVVKGLPKFPGGRFCPGCLAQVNALAANHAEFKSRQTEVVMVFPGPADRVPDFLAQGRVGGASGTERLPFPLLRDADLKAVTALGIAGDWARPSTYILDKSGNAVFAFVGEGTTDRPSVSSLLARLDKLNAAGP
ncbi:peroxiredoxin family protein [Gemmata sp. JC717]|uniref:Peroxiredoxin family protein n=1 Tax=Gemmata algarum TaxID=2975278 RepID=A0ABU5F5N4_9BACT|nr:peroxiredoxin family protein [Gemmata algarum]MDY3556240.1 peroxiredoxin family protein [Gemmata algarum]MDY3562433.1 peroxiredoxin family protein [Gemmata algarum]